MRDIELLIPRVQEQAPNTPEPMAIRHLRDAAIEFCRRTRIWRCKDEFKIKSTEDCIGLVPVQYAQIFEITAARFDGDDESRYVLTPIRKDQLDREQPGWETKEGGPAWITQSNPESVSVAFAATGTLHLDLVLLPSANAPMLPDVLVDTYAKEIAGGAAAEILLRPGDQYNPEIAAPLAQRFGERLDHFQHKVTKGEQRGPLRSRPRWF
jgi:hypothetical protein